MSESLSGALQLSGLTALLKEADGIIKMMTVAPEVCTPEIISILRDHGVTVAAGHSNATFREATDGFRLGHRDSHASL